MNDYLENLKNHNTSKKEEKIEEKKDTSLKQYEITWVKNKSNTSC